MYTQTISNIGLYNYCDYIPKLRVNKPTGWRSDYDIASGAPDPGFDYRSGQIEVCRRCFATDAKFLHCPALYSKLAPSLVTRFGVIPRL